MNSSLTNYFINFICITFGISIGISIGFFFAYKWLSRLLQLKIKENDFNSSEKIDNRYYR